MNNRRTWMVVIAVVIAMIAAVATFSYINSLKQEAYSGSKLMEVYVVKKAISKGLPGEQAIAQQYVAKSNMPQEYKPGAAITDIGDLKNKVALYNFSPGTVVVSGMFEEQSKAQVTTAERIKNGQMAMSFNFDTVRAVGGLLTPGDKVNIFLSYADSANGGKPSESLYYQNVNILAIGSRMAVQPGDASTQTKNAQAQATGDTGLLTFELPPDAAQRLAFIASSADLGTGKMYLALVPPENPLIDPLEPTTLDNYLTKTERSPYEGIEPGPAAQ